MANLKLTNLTTLKAYFSQLAAEHVDIGGFKYGDDSVIKHNNRSNITPSFLWVSPYELVRYGDNFSDNVIKTKPVALSFMKVRESEKFADIDADYAFCEATMEQIVARIIKDKAGAMVGSSWELLATNISSATGRPVESTIGSTRYIGWELKIDFMDNTGIAYDAAKWNS